MGFRRRIVTIGHEVENENEIAENSVIGRNRPSSSCCCACGGLRIYSARRSPSARSVPQNSFPVEVFACGEALSCISRYSLK